MKHALIMGFMCMIPVAAIAACIWCLQNGHNGFAVAMFIFAGCTVPDYSEKPNKKE